MTNQTSQKRIEGILDIARWAPSGDNAQPWKFRVKGALDVEILVRRSNPNVYEYRHGEPTLISAGALLENIVLAAPAFGLIANWTYAGSMGGNDHIRVIFREDPTALVPDLLQQVTRRSVDRRPFRLRSITKEQKASLAQALGPDMKVRWHESTSERLKIAALSAAATNIRLRIPEAFTVHGSIVDWTNHRSENAIPSKALGLDPLTLRLTRWSMRKWSRTKLINGFGAPHMASLQMDFLPGLFSAAYFVICLPRHSTEPGSHPVETLKAGQAIQKFWLTATKLGLVVQPCVAILAFWSYVADNQEFTTSRKAQALADTLATTAETIFGRNQDIIFLGRIGWPRRQSASRSVRLPLSQLLER